MPGKKNSMRGLLDFEMSEVKLKRKRRMLTMCEVCNIQLNSSTQAQIHYNGKTHQRRLRQANQAKTGAGARKVTGSPVQGGALLKSLPVQDLKRFLPLRANISSPLNLFSNFGLMDPVQKAVISHTFSIAQSLKKKQIITCNICHLRFNSTIQAEAHYKGHKHAQKLKAIDKLKSKQRILEKSVCRERGRKKPEDESVSERTEPSQASKPEDVGTDGISITSSSKKLCESKHLSESPAPVLPLDPRLTCDLEPVAKGNGSWRNCSRSLQCPICKVTVNSGSQLEDHYKGFKHRLMLRRRCTLPLKKWARKVDASGAIPCPKHLSLNAAPSDQSHHCNVCDVDVNSEAQLQQQEMEGREKWEMAVFVDQIPAVNWALHDGL
ncbi:hypothetical protein HF521_020196 [Silurus meridionalis]|uniref:C2H2-type domain-containing protein n=1 Tax=Silurus meridionalis TaxID=175797 RepID=A0A8T0BHM6_SILME|nr:hypothetical protein HF521_020196 [Silurus meridionalis]